MIHLDPSIAAAVFVLFVPQLVFLPLLQGAILQRTEVRVRILRGLSVSIVAPACEDNRGRADVARIDHVFELDMGIFRLKFTMNFLMNLCSHLQIIAALLLGGWWVHTEQLAIGGVVAFVSGIGRLNDPWGDFVNYFRDVSVTQVKYRLVANAVNQLAQGHALDAGEGISGSTPTGPTPGHLFSAHVGFLAYLRAIMFSRSKIFRTSAIRPACTDDKR